MSSVWCGPWSRSVRRCRGIWPPRLPGRRRRGTPWRSNALSIPQVLLAVTINPEERVKVGRGPAAAVLQQGGYTPVLVKVINEAGDHQAAAHHAARSRARSYAGAADLSMQRQDQRSPEGRGSPPARRPGGSSRSEMVTSPPMTANLSGLKVEYALALLYSSEAGQREATIGFDVGQGTQDLGFRGEVPVLFDVRPAIPVTLRIRDHDGTPTVAHFTFVDRVGPRASPAAQAARPRPVLPEAGLPRATAAWSCCRPVR